MYSYLIITEDFQSFIANEIKDDELRVSDDGYLDVYRINKDNGTIERYWKGEWTTMKDWYETYGNSQE